MIEDMTMWSTLGTLIRDQDLCTVVCYEDGHPLGFMRALSEFNGWDFQASVFRPTPRAKTGKAWRHIVNKYCARRNQGHPVTKQKLYLVPYVPGERLEKVKLKILAHHMATI